MGQVKRAQKVSVEKRDGKRPVARPNVHVLGSSGYA
jgi:hypothetical protein